MPRKAVALTDLRIRNTKPAETELRLYDGGGLYLSVMPTGARWWRLKYRYQGKEKRAGLGTYPEVSLQQARAARDRSRAMIREGIDPVALKRQARIADRRMQDGAFENVSAQWLEYKRKGAKGKGWAPETYRKAEYVVRQYLNPALRGEPIATLSTSAAAKVIETIAERAPNLAAKARQYLGGIVDFAMRRGLREDGRLLSLRGTLPTYDKGHIPAAIDPDEIEKVVRAVRAHGSPVVRSALVLAMLTAMRPGLIASARWDEIDLVAAEWRVDGKRMKMRVAHVVPLPRQAIAALRDMLPFTAGTEFVFPPLARQKSPHLNRDSLSKALRDMGFRGQHATHGFRGMLRTAGRERLGFDIDLLEAQLAHAKRGDVRKAYDRAVFNDKRRSAMQAWADYLDGMTQNGLP